MTTAAVLLGTSGVLAACGGDGAGAATAACTGPGVTDSAVRFGLIYPDTGPTAEASSSFRAGVDARIGVENAQGGVNGRQLAYDWEDDQNEPSRGLFAARTLIEENRAFGIVQLNANNDISTWLQGEGIPAVAGVSAGQSSYDNVFAVTTYFPETSWGSFVRQQGGSRAAVLGLGFDPAYRQVMNAMIESLAGTGIEVVYTRDVFINDNFSAIAAEIGEVEPDTLVVGAPPEIYASLIQATREAGLGIKVPVGVLGYDPSLLDQFGAQLANGVVAVNSAPFELDLPAHREFLQAMADFAPQLQQRAQQVALQGWIAADMFIEGVWAAGSCPTRLGFITGLGKVDNYTADGLLAPVDLSSALRQNPCYYFVRVSPDGGTFEVIPPAPLCGNSS